MIRKLNVSEVSDVTFRQTPCTNVVSLIE